MRRVVNFYGIGRPGSGYGDACLNMARAFHKSSISVNFNFSKFSSVAISNNLVGCDEAGDINFFVGPPPYLNFDNTRIRADSGKYNIAYFYWEADKLPAYWKRYLLQINEVWAPCNLVADACKKAGFQGKIRVVPTPHDNSMLVKDNELDIPSQISDKYFVSDDVFKFYSIFQWHHRKGPDILLKSYWKTFKKNDNVILILKVNDLGIPGFSKKDIKDDINKIKSKLNLSYYSPIFVIDNILPKKYIRALHTSADCYVSPYRGEGWGMPICDAILHKNPVIITKYGGVSDYLDSNSAGIIRHKMTSVKNMGWSPNIYNKSQRWAEPSAQMTSYLMRDVYKNFNKYKKRADIANKIIKDLSIESFSNIIEEYICQIS